jgi:hypothetical protein
MADRTSAELFGMMFDIVAEELPEDRREAVALRLWKKSRMYDFSPGQMEVDEALRKLGLARLAVDPRWPEDGECWQYGPEPR